MVPMEPASLVMERKMLRGIKRRAERLAAGGRENHVSEGGQTVTAEQGKHRESHAGER
jgi:hypothetical protein